MKKEYTMNVSECSAEIFTIPPDYRVTRESIKMDHKNKFVLVMYKLYGGRTIYRCYSYENLCT